MWCREKLMSIANNHFLKIILEIKNQLSKYLRGMKVKNRI